MYLAWIDSSRAGARDLDYPSCSTRDRYDPSFSSGHKPEPLTPNKGDHFIPTRKVIT